MHPRQCSPGDGPTSFASILDFFPSVLAVGQYSVGATLIGSTATAGPILGMSSPLAMPPFEERFPSSFSAYDSVAFLPRLIYRPTFHRLS